MADTVKQVPWNMNKLKQGMGWGRQLYKQGGPQYYQGKQIAPMSGYTRGALNSMANRALGGSPINRAAQGQLTKTLNGDYLKQGNPYLQGAIGAATKPMVDTYNQQIAPGLDSTFSSAGRYGSGAHAMGQGQAANALMGQIGNVSSNMAYQNYGDERQNQMRGMLMAPDIANQDYKDIAALGQAGQGFDQYNQSLINADKDKWNFQQNSQWDNLGRYMNLLNGVPSGYRQTTDGGSMNPFTTGLGGAMAGASLFGTGGALAGGPIGGLGGAAIGGMLGGGSALLGNMFGW